MAAQGQLLAEVAQGIDAGTLRGTMTRDLGAMSVATLREAHAAVESARSIGKIVLGSL
jgi:hypothetical protein